MRLIRIKNFNNPFVVFSKKEISELFKTDQYKEITAQMSANGLTPVDAILNAGKIKRLIDMLSRKGADDRDKHELFISIFNYHGFYGEDAEIMYELSGFDFKRDAIRSIEDLDKFRANTITDFGFLSKEGARLFQLKRYRGPLSVQEFCDFLKKKVQHYGNNIAPMNLLILLQSNNRNNEIPENFFDEVHTVIQSFNWKFTEEVLVSYLDDKLTSVIVQVHPKLDESIIPFLFPSQQR